MTSVDEFVRTSILTFPSLFPNRTAVLHHALCVVGTGCRWSEDGTMVNEFEFSLWDKEEKLAEMEETLKNYDNRAIREIMGAALRNEIEHSVKVVEEVGTRIHERDDDATLHYADSRWAFINAPLNNIPANVTDDWKEACEEIKQLAEKAGWKF
jgi:hypothetical protein